MQILEVHAQRKLGLVKFIFSRGKSNHTLKRYEQIKCAILETANLLQAYLYLPRTPYKLRNGYLIVEAIDYSVFSCLFS